MNWTPEKLAEALECIDAIHKSVIATQRFIKETMADLRQIRAASDRMDRLITLQNVVLDAPSICPN
jgi:hypothetical protein